MGLHQTNKKFCRAKETINKMKGNLQFGRKYLLTIYWIKLSEMCLYSWILSVFVNFSLPSFLFSFPFFPPSQPSNLSSSLFSFLSFFLASLLLKGDVGKTGECGSISHGLEHSVLYCKGIDIDVVKVSVIPSWTYRFSAIPIFLNQMYITVV